LKYRYATRTVRAGYIRPRGTNNNPVKEKKIRTTTYRVLIKSHDKSSDVQNTIFKIVFYFENAK